MSVFKRLLCVLLTLVILVNIPGTVPKAEAVAAVDDAAILSLALLFTTWAGVTFASSSDAVAVMNQYLGAKPTVRASLTGVITKGLLVEGTKLLLTHDVKAAYEGFVSGIFDFYRTYADSLSGVVEDGLTAGASFSIPYFSASLSDLYNLGPSLCVYPVTSTFYGSISATVNGALKTSACSFKNDSSVLSFGGLNRSINLTSNATSYGSCIAYDEVSKYASLYFCYFNGSTQLYELAQYCTSASISVKTANPTNTYDFERSATVDGSQALSELGSISDDDTRSIDIGAVPGVVSSGLAGATTAPGLTPEEWVEILRKAVGGTISVPIPTTPPTEVTEATEPSETTPTIVTPDILEGMFGGLKGWLESILAAILAAIQAIPEKIDAFQESLTTWWSNTIADIKSWIDIKFQSIADWWTTFWADTISTVKALGLTITEFFTVTFPAWITDVKAWALALPKTITDAIVVALAAAFVPAAGYWDAKIAACMAAFPLFNSIITTGRGLGGFFSGLGSRPPVIYIDLGNSASWAIGGTQKFLDLTWYAQYKPTVDTILSGFLWLLFAWRFFLRLPGLLRGEGGTIDRLGTYFDSKNTKDGK